VKLIEDHGAHQRLDIQLALSRAQSARDRLVEPKVLPQFVEREDIADATRRLMHELAGGILQAAYCSVEPVDQRIELSRRDLVEPPEVGNNLDANLASLVEGHLDELMIAAAT